MFWNALRAFAVVAVLLAAAHLLPTAAVGALAIGVALIASPRTHHGAVETGACIVTMAVMFGLEGAGAFALLAALFSWSLVASLGGLRRLTALAVVCLVTGALCALSLPLALSLPERWAPFAVMAPALAAATPRRVLDEIAVAALGVERAASGRLLALPLTLVAMICGGALDGIGGATAAWACARVATPVALLFLGGRLRVATLVLGALSASLVGAAGAAAAVAGPFALAGPAGLLAAFAALRVHAPAAAARVLRTDRSGTRSGQLRSLSETISIGIGQRSASAGSSQRTPTSAPGA
jgi:hypothetical protein